jgi:hypothetical protein
MRFVLIPFVILSISLVGAADTPAPDPCAGWVVNGYRAGMPQADALAVRPAKAQKAGVYDVKEPGRFAGKLNIGANGRISFYLATMEGVTATEVIAALRDKLGAPVVDGVVQTDGNTIRKMTIWINASCDQSIYVIDTKVFAASGEVSVTNVMIANASNAATANDAAKARGDAAVK